MIIPFLWFEDQLEEAVEFYVRIFDGEVLERMYYPEGAPMPAGTLLQAVFTLHGQQFSGLNGGPHDQFNDAISLSIPCADQAELDRYWDGLLEDGGRPVQCGWLKDKYGVSWQLYPAHIAELLGGDPEAAARANAAMMQMVKIDIAALERARDGG